MHTPPPSLGPVFACAKRQSHPSPKVHDLGIEMAWGKPQHTGRLYRNLRDHAPYAFRFEDVVVHEDDVFCDTEYQCYLSRKTAVGTFIPLSAYLLTLYDRKQVNRDIFVVLAELDRLLPPDRLVTTKGLLDFCHSLGKAEPLPPEPPVDSRTGILAKDLETKGFRLTTFVQEGSRALLSISWLPKPGRRLFFAGILDLRSTREGIVGQWMLPGSCGVLRLLHAEFEQVWAGPSACLTPRGLKHCLLEVDPQARQAVEQSSAWSARPSLPRNKFS